MQRTSTMVGWGLLSGPPSPIICNTIHPGLPADRSFKDSDKWVKRGEKHN